MVEVRDVFNSRPGGIKNRINKLKGKELYAKI